MNDTIHKYFKKTIKDGTILVQLDPENLIGVELLVDSHGQIVKTNRVFDTDIYDDLNVDGFETSSPLEFNLYLKGLVHITRSD